MDPKLRLVSSETTSPEKEVREPNPHERAAAEVAMLLEAIAVRIPRLAAPNAAKKKRARAARTVRREYILSMMDTIGRHQEEYAPLRTFDIAEARDTLEFNDAYRPIAARMAVLLASLKFTMADRLADVVRGAFQAYSLAKPFADVSGNDAFAAELELAAQDLNRKNKPKRKKKE